LETGTGLSRRGNILQPSEDQACFRWTWNESARLHCHDHVTGPLNQLNLSYRSDPPLESREITALLTVGRTPKSTRFSGTQNPRAAFSVRGNSLLGQALAAPLSSRLQRFSG
jgi:hypothetical protein